MINTKKLATEISQFLALNDANIIDENYRLKENIMWDSLSIVRTLSAIEKIYQLILSGEDIYKCETFGDLLLLIERKKSL